MATGSVELGHAWDDTFHGWTDELQLGRKVKKPARAKGSGSSGWTGSPVADRAVADYAGKGSKAAAHARLQGIAKRSTQVMVKITPGKNKTMRSVHDHLAYIARDGEEMAVNRDGRKFTVMCA